MKAKFFSIVPLIIGLCISILNSSCSPLVDDRQPSVVPQLRSQNQSRVNKSQQSLGLNKRKQNESSTSSDALILQAVRPSDHKLPKRSQQQQTPNCNDDTKQSTSAPIKSCRMNSSRHLKETTREGATSPAEKRRLPPDFSHLFREETKDYPEEEIKLLLQKTPEEIRNLFNVINTPLEPNVNLTERIAQFYNDDEGLERGVREESICRTVTRNIYPRQANRFNSLVYVPNDQEFVQVIQAEICHSPDEECNYLQDSMPYGMSSICKQKYAYKKLLYLDPLEKRMASDLFRYPSCCSCYIKSAPFDLRSAQHSQNNSTRSTNSTLQPKIDVTSDSSMEVPVKETQVYTADSEPGSINNKRVVHPDTMAGKAAATGDNQGSPTDLGRRAKALNTKIVEDNSNNHTVVSHEDKVFFSPDNEKR